MVFEKLYKFIGKDIKSMMERPEGHYCLRLHKNRVYYVSEALMKKATNVSSSRRLVAQQHRCTPGKPHQQDLCLVAAGCAGQAGEPGHTCWQAHTLWQVQAHHRSPGCAEQIRKAQGERQAQAVH